MEKFRYYRGKYNRKTPNKIKQLINDSFSSIHTLIPSGNSLPSGILTDTKLHEKIELYHLKQLLLKAWIKVINLHNFNVSKTHLYFNPAILLLLWDGWAMKGYEQEECFPSGTPITLQVFRYCISEPWRFCISGYTLLPVSCASSDHLTPS